LTELEGIGPVYAAKLREQGIVSFADLAAADEATLAGIISAPAWRRINYGDWIVQARLAAAGDRAGLEELQGQLFRRGEDNLGLIRGLGSRSVAALTAAGVVTFADLAAATPQDVESALRQAGVRGSYDYEAWISEAGVRAAGKRVSSGRPRTVYTVPCPQDLSAVTGIGPVLEERLYTAGIGSYWALAELPTDQLAIILDSRLSQSDLEAIKSAAMRRAVETDSLGRTWNGTPPDDFDGLPGIGEVYERRLYDAGICTYDALAATAPERLAGICQAPPMRAPDYAQWVSIAANLAAARRSG
jgi:predicted flap endonuclease-1-like 5' DNA nuclease